MTAPLPPLPAYTDGYDKSEMIAYTKLAVRQALERAAIAAWKAGMVGNIDDAVASIRAMIEEEK